MRLSFFLSLFACAALAACGAAPATDVADEILDITGGTIAKQVTLKASLSLKSGSLHDASQIWLNSGWQRAQAKVCKGIVPTQWQDVQAFDYQGAITDIKQTQSYNLAICAVQFATPKRVAAIGFVVSSQKIETIQP